MLNPSRNSVCGTSSWAFLPWAPTPPAVHSGLIADPGHLSELHWRFQNRLQNRLFTLQESQQGGGRKAMQTTQSWEAYVQNVSLREAEWNWIPVLQVAHGAAWISGLKLSWVGLWGKLKVGSRQDVGSDVQLLPTPVPRLRNTKFLGSSFPLGSPLSDSTDRTIISYKTDWSAPSGPLTQNTYPAEQAAALKSIWLVQSYQDKWPMSGKHWENCFMGFSKGWGAQWQQSQPIHRVLCAQPGGPNSWKHHCWDTEPPGPHLSHSVQEEATSYDLTSNCTSSKVYWPHGEERQGANAGGAGGRGGSAQGKGPTSIPETQPDQAAASNPVQFRNALGSHVDSWGQWSFK